MPQQAVTLVLAVEVKMVADSGETDQEIIQRASETSEWEDFDVRQAVVITRLSA